MTRRLLRANRDSSHTGVRGGRRVLAVVVALAAALSIGAWTATRLIESPREAAANAAAPAPSLITVPVQLRVVGDEVISRGLVSATQTVEVISPLAGHNAQRALISGRLPKTGSEVEGASVVVEVSGRPIIALEGDVPAYRDLRSGDTGSDVQRLNAALAAAGYDVDDSSSTYGAATQGAVRAVYRRAGYSPPPGGGLPASEVVYMASLPASVVSVDAVLGGDLAASSIKVASGALVVTADIPPDQAGLLTPGAEVVISSEILGRSVTGRIGGAKREVSAGATDGEGEEAGGRATVRATDPSAAGGVTVVPDKPLPSAWAGQDVRVRVVAASTGKRVLAVPATAIVMDGVGQTEVVIVDADATSVADANPRRVRVDVGVVGAGWAQVTPIDDGRLREGDPVQLSAETNGG